jgi:hypothetical protein
MGYLLNVVNIHSLLISEVCNSWKYYVNYFSYIAIASLIVQKYSHFTDRLHNTQIQ